MSLHPAAEEQSNQDVSEIPCLHRKSWLCGRHVRRRSKQESRVQQDKAACAGFRLDYLAGGGYLSRKPLWYTQLDVWCAKSNFDHCHPWSTNPVTELVRVICAYPASAFLLKPGFVHRGRWRRNTPKASNVSTETSHSSSATRTSEDSEIGGEVIY